LVKVGVEGEGPCTDVMEINRPDDLGDIANLGLTLSEAKRLLAGVQRKIVAAQAREYAPEARSPTACHMMTPSGRRKAVIVAQVE